MGKSFLERVGIVQSISTDDPNVDIDQAMAAAQTAQSGNLPEVDTSNISMNPETVLDEVYAQSENELDPANDIHRLSDFIKSLPPELPEKTKQTTVGGILKASGIRLDGLVQDGADRLQLLRSAVEQTKNDHGNLCAEAGEDIAKLEAMIEAAKQKMLDSQGRTTQLTAIFESAIKEIEELMVFANGIGS